MTMRSFCSMTTLALAVILGTQAALPGAGMAQTAGDRMYGRVTTTSGDSYEGYLRWDQNEGSWTDLLNGSKLLPERNREDAVRLAREAGDEHRERSVEFLGIRISWDDDEDFPELAQSAVRFGHVSRILSQGNSAAIVRLKSGEEVELRGRSTDIGRAFRGLVVDAPGTGTVELGWDDLDEVELMEAPPGLGLPRAERLHGTLLDRWGNEYTGYVAWDLDEILTSDVLDGEEGGRDREIPFRNIAAIERNGSDAARVVLANGDEIVLEGSNDVDDSNRGIEVADIGLGQVTVRWREFESLRFHPPVSPIRYDDFDGGRRLRGTVVTGSGEEVAGFIRWDNDEERSWEILDGEFRGVSYDIELGNVQRIEKRASGSAEVTLWDGRRFELEGSNDVNRDNKGIFVDTGDRETVAVSWRDFREVRFEVR